MRVLGSIGKKKEHGDREQESRQSLDEEEQLPAVQAERAIQLQDEARKRPADHIGQRNGNEIGSRIARAQRRWEPQRQIENHARRKTCFGKTQEKTQDVEARRSCDERVRRG